MTALKPTKLPPALRLFWLVTAAMTLLSIAYTLSMTYLFKLPYPYGPPQFFADDRWFDFTIYHDRFQNFRTASFWDKYDYPFTYPAPLAVLYGVLYKVPHVLRYYLVAYAGAVTAGALILIRKLRERGIAHWIAIAFTLSIFLVNYPLRTLFESANTEGVVALIAAFGVYFVLRDRCWLGGALIAIAGTMKLFPFVLLALLLSKRRYREFAWAFVVAVSVNFASLAIVGPTISEAQRHINDGIRYVKYTFLFSTNPAAVTFNHSFFTLVKFAVILTHRHLYPFTIHTRADFLARRAMESTVLDPTFTVYVALAGLFGIFAYFRWMRTMPMLNQVLALTACALVLPPLSADYTLIHLLFPFALLCMYATDMWREGIRVPGLNAAFLCITPIFCFQTYITYRYRYSCETRALGLIALLVVVLRYPFPWREVDREHHQTATEAAAAG